MIAFLCKESNHQSFMRVFVYDLISTCRKSMPLFFQNLVILCVRIWPEPFNWPCHVSQLTIDKTLDLDRAAKRNPVLCAIIFIVREAIVNNTARLDAQSSSSSSSYITNNSEFKDYYLYVSILTISRFKIFVHFCLLLSIFNIIFFKIIETLCHWVCDKKSSDELFEYFGKNLSIEGEQFQNNDLFILNRKLTYKL